MKMTADMSFDELLALAEQSPDAVHEIERRFGAKVAVLVVDFSSMRQRMDAFGTVSALSTIRRACAVYSPAVTQFNGRIVKTVADTIFAVFAQPLDAFSAVLDGHARMRGFNRDRSGNIVDRQPNAPIYPRAGLGFGESLILPDGNLYGPEINRAFILGEDVARDHEILASCDFVEALGVPPVGVGVHASSHDREVEAGFPFHVYTDYRAEDD